MSLLRVLIYESDAFGFARVGVHDDVACYGVRPERHPSGLRRCGKRRAGTAEVRTRCAASLTVSAIVTRRAPVVFLRQYCRAAYREAAVFPSFFNRPFQQPFAAGEFHSGQELPVRQSWVIFIIPAHADELFDAVVIGRKLGVSDGPVIAVPIVACGFQLVIRQPVALAAPHNRAASDVAASNPVERFFVSRRVWVINVVNKELMAVLVARVTLRLHGLAFAEHRRVAELAAILHLVRPLVLCEVFHRVELAARFQHDHAHAFFSKLFRGISARRA